MALHRHCALCGQPPAAAVNLGPLLGPIREARGGTTDELYVHRLCALWSSEVFETEKGTLRSVLAAIKRGRLMRCSHCGHRGATLGCRVPACNHSYHVACAKDAGATYFCESYQVACPDHAPQFRGESKQQTRRTPFTPFRGAVAAAPGAYELEGAGGEPGGGGGGGFMGPAQTPGGREAEGEEGDLMSPPTDLPAAFVKGRKRGRAAAAAQHIVQAKAALKRARKELERRRRVEPESSDDDEHFQKKESRRLARDTAKLNPITLVGDGTAVQHVFIKSPPPGKGPPQAQHPQATPAQQQQQPTVETAVVGSIAATDFNSVAGLDSVVRQLREMVLLPMQYPELFEGMGLRPPRGILFHGVPGTGKTLVARALAGACAKHSPTPVTFFARKGADCLGKFHGEAERTLRLLFEEAGRRAPAIIFLDELDALVPCRSARAGGGDQIYASVVSTLLSLMDGVTDRGAVIVIGATNRPEAIDPALRRPGRFDREVYFGLPTPAQRLAILRVHTRRWAAPPPEDLLQQVAARAEGFAGADLQALCTAAVMAAVRRSSPLLLEQVEKEAAAAPRAAGAVALQHSQRQLQQQEQQAARRHAMLDGITVQPCDWREALAGAPPPCSRRHGMAALEAEAAAPLQQYALPLLEQPLGQLLAALDAADLPLPPPAAEAAKMAAAAASADISRAKPGAEDNDRQQQETLEAVLLKHAALLPPSGQPTAAPGGSAGGAAQGCGQQAATTTADEEEQLLRIGRSYPPCRLLLWGEGEQGQEAAAGALLKLLDGCPVHCLSLPSLVVEGGDDAAAGCVALVSEALRRAGPSQPCIFYLPRLESWALSQARMKPEELAQGGWYCLAGGPDGDGSSSDSDQEMGEAVEPLSAPRGGGGSALQSPRFAATATSPLGSSPGHHGFLLAPSPFSGLLPLEDRVGHTPAVARALRSITQQHRQQQQQQQQGSSGADEGPTMQQRAASASIEPSTAGRPPRPPPALAPPVSLAPIRTSASPDQQQQQQAGTANRGARGSRAQRTGAAPPPAAPASGSRSSRATRTGIRAAVQPAPAAAAGGLLRLERDGAHVEEGEEAEVDVVCLSQAWNVFESLMRQVPASQPVIVLATCHASSEATPANLIQFFAGPALGAAAAGPSKPPQEGQVQGRLGQLLGQPGAPAGAADVAAPGIVRIGQPSQGAWQHAAAAAAEQVAALTATQAAQQLHQQLLAAAEAVAAEAGEGDSPAAAGGTQHALSVPSQQQQHHHEEQGQQCNTAELEQGLRLFDQLLSFQRWLGAMLAKQRVARLDRWVAPHGGGGGGGRRRSGAAGVLTFGQIAELCQRGAYDSPNALQADAAATAAAILAAAEEAELQAEQRGRRQQGPASPIGRQHTQAVVTAACSVHDQVDSACFTLRQRLSLAEGASERLLAAAAAHVRHLQRKKEAEERQQLEEAERQRQQQHQQHQQQEEDQQQGDGEDEQMLLAGEEAGQEKEQAAAAAAAGEEQQEEGNEDGLQLTQPEGGTQQTASPAGGPGHRHEHSLLAAAREAAADTLTPPAAPQQHQQQQEPPELQPASAAEQRLEQQRRAAHVAQLLQQQLRRLLLLALQQRLPPAAPAEVPAWQALHESAGRLSAAATAACSRAVGEAAEEECAQLMAADAAAAEQLVGQLAAQCMAELSAAEPLEGK